MGRYSNFIPPDEEFSRQERGDWTSYGRHKNSEYKRTQQFLDKLDNTKIEPLETYSTILDPNAERPRPLRLKRSLSDHDRKSPSWKKVRGSSPYKKPSDSPKYQKTKNRFNKNLHKEVLPKPKIIDGRILGEDEANRIKAKLKNRTKRAGK